MVSLANRSIGDQPSFSHESDSVHIHEDTDDVALINCNSTNNRPRFYTGHTCCIIGLEIACVVGLVVESFLLPLASQYRECSANSVVIYTHCGLWCLLFVCDSYLQYHQSVFCCYGYLDFYRKSKLLRKITFLIYSAGNAVLLVLLVILQTFCRSVDKCTEANVLTPMHCLQIVISVEAVLSLPFLVRYLILTAMFNAKKTASDVERDEMLISYAQSSPRLGDIGFRDESCIEAVMEKQADMIHYLKQHNACLSKKIVRLTEQLKVNHTKP